MAGLLSGPTRSQILGMTASACGVKLRPAVSEAFLTVLGLGNEARELWVSVTCRAQARARQQQALCGLGPQNVQGNLTDRRFNLGCC